MKDDMVTSWGRRSDASARSDRRRAEEPRDSPTNLLDMESNELAQRLRERAQLHHLRLIAMTSSRQHLGREAARNAGFERYLLKPIAAADLSALLAHSRGESSSQP
jgi:CheY-like chemotaxis protein